MSVALSHTYANIYSNYHQSFTLRKTSYQLPAAYTSVSTASSANVVFAPTKSIESAPCVLSSLIVTSASSKMSVTICPATPPVIVVIVFPPASPVTRTTLLSTANVAAAAPQVTDSTAEAIAPSDITKSPLEIVSEALRSAPR